MQEPQAITIEEPGTPRHGRDERERGDNSSVGGGPLIRPPQFRLRTLLAVMAGASLLFALIQVLEPVWSTLLVFFLILVTAHVSANRWGTSGRRSTRTRRSESEHGDEPHAGSGTPRRVEAPQHPLPRTSLAEQNGISTTMWVMTGVGAVLGGSLVGFALVVLYWYTAGLAAIALGTLSAAALGGFLGFAVSSFLEVAAGALGEASGPVRRRH